MKKKRNFLLKSILLQLNFSLEKAGILLVLVLVFSIQAKAYSQTRITAKRQGVTIDEVLKEVREKSGYRFLYRVEEVNRYGKRDIDVIRISPMKWRMRSLLSGRKNNGRTPG